MGNICKALGALCSPSGGYGHRPRPAKDLQLHGGTLDAGDAQGHPSVVDFIVTEVLLQHKHLIINLHT